MKIADAVVLLVPQIATSSSWFGRTLGYVKQSLLAEHGDGRKLQRRMVIGICAVKMADPNGAVDGAHTNRTIALGDDLAGLSPYVVFRMRVIETKLIAEPLARSARRAVGRPDAAQGEQATETAFKRLPLSQYNVIHLALHGYADPEYPDRSALVFAPETPPIDDGLLQVREIRKLSLDTSLVTLSACNTGIGPVGEDGIANIVNAFIEAGAQSVVSTLWEIEDHTTAQLMIDFYQHLGRGEGKAEALRQAQIDLLKSGDPPYFWAGFELDGEPHETLLANSKSTSSFRSGQ